jgi:hypothetical protein
LANLALIVGVQRCWNAIAIYARIHLRALRTRLAHSGAAFHTKLDDVEPDRRAWNKSEQAVHSNLLAGQTKNG